MPFHYLGMPITVILASGAIAVELLLLIDGAPPSQLMHWNYFAFGIFELVTLTLTSLIFMNDKVNPEFCSMTKLIHIHYLVLPHPVWLLIKPMSTPFFAQSLIQGS